GTVDQFKEKQRIASAEDDDADVFGYHFEKEMLAVNLFHMRGGKIVDRRDFFWADLPVLIAEASDADSTFLSSRTLSISAANGKGEGSASVFNPSAFFSVFLKQLYLDQPYVPPAILVPVDFPDRAL